MYLGHMAAQIRGKLTHSLSCPVRGVIVQPINAILSQIGRPGRFDNHVASRVPPGRAQGIVHVLGTCHQCTGEDVA
jgi:hypothetical protein